MANHDPSMHEVPPSSIQAKLIAAAQLIVQHMRADAAEVDEQREAYTAMHRDHTSACNCGLTPELTAVQIISQLWVPYQQYCFMVEQTKRARKN